MTPTLPSDAGSEFSGVRITGGVGGAGAGAGAGAVVGVGAT